MDPLEEIAAIRRRLAQLEAVATAATQPTEGDKPMSKSLGSAIDAHYGNQPPPDRERARLQAIADRFQVDPALESTLAARAKDPAGYDAEMKRVGAFQGLELAVYGRGRDAAIKLGTFVPAKEEGTK